MASKSVDDRWHVVSRKTGKRVESPRYGMGKRWRARYRIAAGGRQITRAFDRKIDAQRWLDEVTTDITTGRYLDPRRARTTVGEWSEEWLKGYATNRASTYRQAEVHLKLINAAFGDVRLSEVKASAIRTWTATLQAEGRAPSYVYATYRRLAQLMGDAVIDGYLTASPCSRKTAPPMGKQRPYVATTAQVWALHDAFPVNLRPAVLLGAFAGLRLAEAAALRAIDVDFMRGIITPAIQYPAEPLKSEHSRSAIPIPGELSLMLSAAVARGDGTHIVTDAIGRGSTPWAIERAMRAARATVEDLPDGFRFHDLRHYFASLLIAAGLDVKVVQLRLRHEQATTTLNVYGHMWPDKDESSRAAVGDVLAAREDSLRTEG